MARSVLVELHMRDEYHIAELEPGRNDGPTVIDIGAHIGIFAVVLCERFPASRVWSYEPSPVSFGYLSANVRDNGLADRVHIFNQAVSDRDGTMTLFEDRNASAANTAFPELIREGQRPIEVPTCGFARVVAEVGERIDLAKIDCEGGEYDILLDTEDAPWRLVDRVALEYHPVQGRSWKGLATRLQSLGFVERAHEFRGQDWGTAFFTRDMVSKH
jgi:FkbM family methyltransferase